MFSRSFVNDERLDTIVVVMLTKYVLKAKAIIDRINSRKQPYPFHINPDEYHSRYIISPYHYCDPRRKSHYKVITAWITKNLPKDASILEVGCAVGLYGLWLRELGYSNYYGVDINSLLVKVGKMVEPPLNLLCMDGRQLALRNRRFTLVGYMNNFFDYDPPFFIREGLRVANEWLELDGLDAEYLWQTERGTRGYKYLPKRNEVYKWLKDHKIIIDARPTPDRHLYIVEVQH